MFAGAVFLQHPGHDRLLSAELRGAEYHRAALQELRTMVSADWAGQRGILRAACSERSAALPRHRRSETMTLSKLTARNTSGALRGSRPDGSPTSSFTIGASGPERKRINVSRG